MGTGDGFMAIILARMGFQVTTVDVDSTMLENARRNAEQAGVEGRIQFICSDVTSLPFAGGDFPAVVTFNILHHLVEWEKAVDEAKRVCAEGGRFLLAELNQAGREAVEALHRVRGKEHPYVAVDGKLVEAELSREGWKVRAVGLPYNTLWIGEKPL